MLTDAPEREQALNPSGSFIVQAPAGSGKTELLTQRFLVLLGAVSQPEEILAMTFTRKSAAEMRARIILALKQAETEPEPETPHGKKTWQLAKKVLAENHKKQWHLPESPERLRIQTIDAFNSTLTRQLPLMAGVGAAPDIAQQPQPLYRAAVRELMTHLEQKLPWSDAIASLLRHLDNQPENAMELLIKLLERRDQWLSYITLQADDPLLRETLEKQLALVTRDILKNISQRMPENLQSELLALARYAADNLGLPSPEKFPGDAPCDRSVWLQLRNLLLTNDDEWRRQVDKRTGFPADNKVMKERMRALLADLSQNAALENAFRELRYAPQPTFRDSQWQMLSALHQILKVAVAELRLSFQQHRQIDYTENSLAALNALGSEDSPTDLSLALDCQIRHILVDEFQDTSATQSRLLEKLTLGWQAGDGRTLFLVGDPMQSIYRFREAEVGLFIRARSIGLGHLPLQFLKLSVNFRSTAGIVSWVNQHFPTVFPPYDDIATGAVSYSPGVAAKNTVQSEPSVRLLPAPLKAGQQGGQIVSLIQEHRALAPTESIAVLVRSRSHLADIIPALKEAGIHWCAIGIDPLSARPVIQDLISLTRALLDPADRVAWLSILRAPWCGLALADLLKIAGPAKNATIWSRLAADPDLSPEGKQRLRRILPVLAGRLQNRERFTLRYQVESAWLLLGGAAAVSSPGDLKDATVFFKLLGQFDQQGLIPDAASLKEAVATLYAAPDSLTDNPVQIMTIHNAKGLEFDTVIVPHLEKKVTGDKKQLLLWMERPGIDEQNALLIAPVHATGESPDTIYEYIRRENEIRNANEQSRLLYVAVTRAKKNLALLFDVSEEGKPPTGSLLSRLWPAIQHSIPPIPTAPDVARLPGEKKSTHTLRRLPAAWINPIRENRPDNTAAIHRSADGFTLTEAAPRQIGIVIHAILQRLCEAGSALWHTHTEAWIRQMLIQTGLPPAALDSAIVKVRQAIDRLLNDERGRWIVHPHEDAAAELAVTTLIDEKPVSLVIDRTFVDTDGSRWIIDFKTSAPESGDIEQFLKEEEVRYQKQLFLYRQAMMGLDKRPIRMGLYFPQIPAFREVIKTD